MQKSSTKEETPQEAASLFGRTKIRVLFWERVRVRGCQKELCHVKYTWDQRKTEDGRNMYIIAGLGNPGRKYENTRHNTGFRVLDGLADRYGIAVEQRKHKALCGTGRVEGQKVLLMKPQTYMNLSGESIREAVEYYRVDPECELLVIYDDISLEPGQLRIRKKGSAGGHNGVKDIIRHLGTQVFPRIKVGVGEKPEGYDLADYVLGHFSPEDAQKMQEACNRAVMAAAAVLSEGPDRAMNDFN